MQNYPLTMPGNQIATVTLYPDHAQAYSESPFSYRGQVQDWGGQRWRAEFSLPRLRHSQAQPWLNFGLALRGMVGTFLMGDPRVCRSLGVGGGIPLVDGAGQTGDTLTVRGAPLGVNTWLKDGDYLQLGAGAASRLHKISGDVDTDATGRATIAIWPDLRSSPIDGAPIVLDNPRGVWRMANPTPGWTSGANGFYDISFSAVEVLL